jgi:hypothetical protein
MAKSQDDATALAAIPVLYNKCARGSGFAQFDIHKIKDAGSSVTVMGSCSQVDHVFCGTHQDPDYPSMVALLHGDKFQIYGASLEIVSQEEEVGSQVTLRLTHDGTSPEVLVIYGTKQVNS